MGYEFEFNETKSAETKADPNRGIDFIEAQELFTNDGTVLIIHLAYVPETRFKAIGFIAGRVWAAIYTWRGDKIRLISVRKAQRKEIRSRKYRCEDARAVFAEMAAEIDTKALAAGAGGADFSSFDYETRVDILFCAYWAEFQAAQQRLILERVTK